MASIFATIQGEGPYAGAPSIFIRLGGCNLQCHGCDTDYTTTVETWSVGSIVEKVGFEAGKHTYLPLVVITGGEPFRQNLSLLIAELDSKRYRIQIETNGTYQNDQCLLPPNLTVVCSPKSRTSHCWADYWKYVVEYGHVSEQDGLPTSVLGNYDLTPARPPQGFTRHKVYVQPMDAKDPVANRRNLETAVASCRKYGYTLGLQLHKYLGLE